MLVFGTTLSPATKANEHIFVYHYDFYYIWLGFSFHSWKRCLYRLKIYFVCFFVVVVRQTIYSVEFRMTSLIMWNVDLLKCAVNVEMHRPLGWNAIFYFSLLRVCWNHGLVFSYLAAKNWQHIEYSRTIYTLAVAACCQFFAASQFFAWNQIRWVNCNSSHIESFI